MPERLPVVKVAVAGGGHDDLVALLGRTHAACDALQALISGTECLLATPQHLMMQLH